MEYALRVHIIPVGDDIVDRIVKPAEVNRADRIYLVRMRGKDIFRGIEEEARTQLLARQVVVESDLREIEADFYNFTEILRTYGEIMRDEQRQGNLIFFNVSTGGKLNSLAGMLACFMFGGTPYFCKQDFELGTIPDPPEILSLPMYNIEKPSEDHVRFLMTLQAFSSKKTGNKLSKGECLDAMKVLHPEIPLAGKTSGDYNKLKFRYLDKLSERGYISVEPGIRGKISIAEEGKFAIEIFSAYYGLQQDTVQD